LSKAQGLIEMRDRPFQDTFADILDTDAILALPEA
jgi:hypothetical protein